MIISNWSIRSILIIFFCMGTLSVAQASDPLEANDFCKKAKEKIAELRNNGVSEKIIALGVAAISADSLVQLQANSVEQGTHTLGELIYNASVCRRTASSWSHWMKTATRLLATSSENRRVTVPELTFDGEFRLTSNELGYVFLSTPIVQISGDGCSVSSPAVDKMQMSVDANAFISYNDFNWTVTGWQGAGASTLDWQFTSSGLGNCDGTWSSSYILIDGTNATTYDDVTNSLYAIVPIDGNNYLFAMKVIAGANGLEITLDGSVALPWLTAEIAEQAGITLGSVDLSTTPASVSFPKLRLENYADNSIQFFDIALSIDLQAQPISFTLVSAVPVP